MGPIAVGENDLLALGKGRLRDCVLQVRYVSADGQLVTGGGPTVKNVTGFDLPRLMIGALGTLGCIAEVVIRTNPLPASSVWFTSTDANPFAAYDAVLRPSAVLWNGEQTWVLLEGHPVDVLAEAQALGSVGRFAETDRLPVPPPNRWSLTPADLRTPPTGVDNFLAAVGVGLLFADKLQPPRQPDPAAQTVSEQIKQQFDPTGRLNPGRVPGR